MTAINLNGGHFQQKLLPRNGVYSVAESKSIDTCDWLVFTWYIWTKNKLVLGL